MARKRWRESFKGDTIRRGRSWLDGAGGHLIRKRSGAEAWEWVSEFYCGFVANARNGDQSVLCLLGDSGLQLRKQGSRLYVHSGVNCEPGQRPARPWQRVHVSKEHALARSAAAAWSGLIFFKPFQPGRLWTLFNTNGAKHPQNSHFLWTL